MNLKPSQQGQTLIETVVAIFIMTMGVTSALGLATFAFNATSNVSKQLIAMGLAREGIEAVINMRDTNWLSADPVSSDCTNFANTPPDSTGYCYKDWLNPNSGRGYDLSVPDGTDTYRVSLGIDNERSTDQLWTLEQTNKVFGLDYDPAGANGFYYVPPGGVTDGTSDYFREITISKVSTAPYNTTEGNDIGAQLVVKSQVWWKDRKCPSPPKKAPAGGPCLITLELHLTNWKNY